MTEGKTMKYKEEIINRFWDYQRGKYSQYDLYFEPTKNKKSRPPVFYPETEWLNLIINPAANKQEILSLKKFNCQINISNVYKLIDI